MSLYGLARSRPHSVRACRYGVSTRHYHCEDCEHFHVDCELGDHIEWYLKNDRFNLLPEAVQVEYLNRKRKELEKIQQELLKDIAEAEQKKNDDEA